MSRKRRIFDIDMPDEPADITETFPAGKVEDDRPRKNPMATAIADTASSAQDRREIEARIRSENDALAHEFVRLKNLGLVVELVPLDQIRTEKLVRDRAVGIDYELGELKDSIKELGLSNPIRIEARADGGYELIQGYRRLSAYRELLDETGDTTYQAIPAAVSQAGDSLEDLYRRMVDENLVRKDISFAEMAQLAMDYAADPDTQENDQDKAVAQLFKSASYQKRSYVRSFIRLLGHLGKDLQFAPAIPRALGLGLLARIEENDGLVRAVRADLAALDNRSEQEELTVLRRHAKVAEDAAPKPLPASTTVRPTAAKTSIQFDREEGRGKCVAAKGKLEIKLDRDFSTVDARQLEQAVRRFLDDLDG